MVPKVAVVALFLLLRNFVRAIRLRRQEIDLEVGSDEKGSPQAKLLKHRKNKERTARTIEGLSTHSLPIHMHTCASVTTHDHTLEDTRVRTCTRTRVHAHAHACMHTHACAQTHTLGGAGRAEGFTGIYASMLVAAAENLPLGILVVWKFGPKFLSLAYFNGA